MEFFFIVLILVPFNFLPSSHYGLFLFFILLFLILLSFCLYVFCQLGMVSLLLIMVLSSSCNTLKVFSVFVSPLFCQSFFFAPLFLNMFSSTGLSLVELFPYVLTFLIALLPTFFLPVTISALCFWLILSFYSFTLFCSSMGSSLLLTCLWVCLTFSRLWFYSLFTTPLAAVEYIFLPLYHSISFAVYALHLTSLILLWNVASILHISSYFQSCGILCSIDKESPPQLCTIPSYRVPCYLCIMQNFLQCLNWRHLSHKVGFSFFICSWMLSLPIIICGFRLCFSNSSLKIGRPISLLSSSLQGTRMSTTSLEYIFIISSFMNSARSLLYTVLHWGSIF